MSRPILSLNSKRTTSSIIKRQTCRKRRALAMQIAYREAQALRASVWLSSQWPALFSLSLPTSPLVFALGIHKPIHTAYLQQTSQLISKLSYHSVCRYLTMLTQRKAYLMACSDSQSLRYGLNGQPVGHVCAKHRAYARQQLRQRESVSISAKVKQPSGPLHSP